MFAIILSLIFPGLGQFYCGKNGRAIIMVILGLTPLFFIAVVWSLVDIVILYRRGEVPKLERREIILGLVLFFIVVPLCLFIMLSGMFATFNWYSETYNNPKVTLEEGKDIVSALKKYKKENGIYPNELQSIISSNPVRSRWNSDAWGQSYQYSISRDKTTFILISKGKDKALGTEDDIVFE
jgi:hypothetical protein